MMISPEDYLNEILALIWISISVIVGILIALRYQIYREYALQLVGIDFLKIIDILVKNYYFFILQL